MSGQRFLLEIGVEELPASFIPPALEQLEAALRTAFSRLRIEHGEIASKATPRRLALLAENVAERQADTVVETFGPPRSACFDDHGRPTKALLGFARAQRVEPQQVEFRTDDRGRELAFVCRTEHGRPTEEALADALAEVVLAPSFPKTMRWAHRKIRYGRPIRYLLALLGKRPIEFAIEDIRSDRFTRGHRFLGHDRVEVPSATEYEQVLSREGVIVSPAERRARIQEQVDGLARSCDAHALFMEELLDENVYLVEHPTAFMGRFSKEFLNVPEVVVTTVLRKHQKYFPLADSSGLLLPCFIAIRDGGQEGLDNVRRGAEVVVEGRLRDAVFFYQTDASRPLADRVADLDRVVFLEGLGSLRDKAARVERLAARLAEAVGMAPDQQAHLARAARLCKADLVTHMVIEFTDLQGVIGGVYARASGEPEPVATAIAEHYLPRFAGDGLPRTLAGQLLSLADKVDTVVGCLSLGLAPTGSQDPQGIRRRIQGMAAIVAHERLPVNLAELCRWSCQEYGIDPANIQPVYGEILLQRAHAVLEAEGVGRDLREAVLDLGWDAFPDALRRAQQIRAMRQEEPEVLEAAAIVATRAANIVTQRTSDTTDVDPSLFEYETERELLSAIEKLERELADISESIVPRIRQFAQLAPIMDRFFYEVMVMVEDERLRNNRLAMLYRAHRIFMTVLAFRHLEL